MREARLGDVVASMKNGMYKPASEYADDGLPCLRMYNIDAGSIVWRDIKRMKVTPHEYADYGLHEGDLLVNRVNSRELVGKAAVIPASLEPSVFESKNIRVRLDTSKVLPKFINYQLFARGSKHFASNAQQVVGMASISQGQLSDFPIVLTGIDEQREIVAELEKQFSRLDEAVANLQRVKANLKRYKASVLKAAVEGRLVETEATLARREGRTYETGEQLLQRILEERRVKWTGRGKYKEPELPRIEHTFDLPGGWTWATLGHLSLSVKDGPHYSPKYADEGIPFISGGNVRPEGIDFTSTKYITNELHQELSKRCKPEVGDLLYTKGGTTGIARVNTDPREFNVWVHVAVLKLAEPLHRFYVQHALNSQHCYRQAQEYTHGVGNQDLGLTRMVWITVPLPPQAEQARIVAEVDRHLSIIREVEAEVDANLQRAQALRQSVLEKAFSGEPSLGLSQAVRNAASEAKPSKALESATVVMAARIVAAHYQEPTFGRVRLQKQLHLATYIAQVATNDEYARKQAGPLDMTMLAGVTKRVNDLGWFRETERADKVHGGKAYGYSALTKADDYRQHLNALTPTQQKVIDELIWLMRNWTTEQCELLSTVYAAWNDLILWNRPPTEQAVIDQVHNHWHESKRKFSAEKIVEMMHKIKDWGYTPVGFGRPTFGQAADTASGDLFPSQTDC